MILSRSSLSLNGICPAVDEKIPALAKVIINPKGQIFAQNRDCILGISEVPQSVLDLIPLQDIEPLETSQEAVQSIISGTGNKVLPEPVNFVLTHSDLKGVVKHLPNKNTYKGNTDYLSVGKNFVFKIFSGVRDCFFNITKENIPQKKMVQDDFSLELKMNFNTNPKNWIAINKKRILALLTTIHKVMDDSDDMAEIGMSINYETNILFLKGKNKKTKQNLYSIFYGEKMKEKKSITERKFFYD